MYQGKDPFLKSLRESGHVVIVERKCINEDLATADLFQKLRHLILEYTYPRCFYPAGEAPYTGMDFFVREVYRFSFGSRIPGPF
jgi:hypothetical protein